MKSKNAKRLAGLLCAGLLSACGGGGSTSSAQPVATDAASAVKMLENQGVLPVLNRDSTVAGTATNSLGIRDDINAYILALPDTAPQIKSLQQLAGAYQKVLLVDTANAAAVKTADDALINAINCLDTQYDETTSIKRASMLQKLTVNTETRFTAYEAFNKATSGFVTELPAKGVGCAN